MRIVTQVLSFVLFGSVYSQEYYDDLRMAHYPLKSSNILKNFEIRSNSLNSAKTEFEKYANHIHFIANRDNDTVLYRVKVEVLPPNKKNTQKKIKSGKTKKYIVPLKKNSMKLSNFETFMRKLAESNHIMKNFDSNVPTTTEIHKMVPTKPIKMKYKPFLSKLSNYSKIIRPVKNRIITLTV